MSQNANQYPEPIFDLDAVAALLGLTLDEAMALLAEEAP